MGNAKKKSTQENCEKRERTIRRNSFQQKTIFVNCFTWEIDTLKQKLNK